jgi:hypothetical protein
VISNSQKHASWSNTWKIMAWTEITHVISVKSNPPQMEIAKALADTFSSFFSPFLPLLQQWQGMSNFHHLLHVQA